MNGRIAVRGMALAKAYPIVEQKIDTGLRPVEDTAAELERLQAASERCSNALTGIIQQISKEKGPEDAGILDFQLLLLEDDNYIGAIKRLITEEKANCEYAVSVCSQRYRTELASLDNTYLNERSGSFVRSRTVRRKSPMTAKKSLLLWILRRRKSSSSAGRGFRGSSLKKAACPRIASYWRAP